MTRGAEKSTQSKVTRALSPRILKMNERRKELKASGAIILGRPKGVLNAKTIAKIKGKEAFDKAVAERAGLLADDLFRNSRNGDTQAAKVLLEHTFGKPKDNSLRDVVTAFSLLAFATHAANLGAQPIDANKDVTKIEPLPSTLPHPRPSSEE